MLDSVAAQLEQLPRRMPRYEERSFELVLRAVIQLRETQRRWYIVGIRDSENGMEVMGFEPQCRHHTAGDGWFVLPTAFFHRAAKLTGDELVIQLSVDCVRLADVDAIPAD